jgi:DNA-binding CsgD family transcriptional regulator
MHIGVTDAPARAAIHDAPDRRHQRGDDQPRPIKVRYVLGPGPADRAYLLSRTPPPVPHEQQSAWALLARAREAAIRGDEAACRKATAKALTSRADPRLHAHATSTFGLLELGLGNSEAAAECLACCAHLVATLQPDAIAALATFEADHVEALLALSRRDDAKEAAKRQHDHARRTRSGEGLAAVARCRGLLAEDSSLQVHFEAALDLHNLSPGSFEHARTELAYGQRLRRARRRAGAREHLTVALAVFEQLGAVPWASRARQELEATSITHRPPNDAASRDDLTPQELRVCGLIAEGASVREAATRLYLSTKTIEAHLTRAYRKLGVHNRAQLVIALDPYREHH